LLRFADGSLGQSELSWTARGSLDLRNEVFGTEGSLFTDVTRSTPIHGFVRGTGSYLLEKAESASGWVFPLPDEARVYVYHEEMKHFVECVARRQQPRETFADGLVVNTIIDAAYRSMREHRWVTHGRVGGQKAVHKACTATRRVKWKGGCIIGP